jgi:hypothetical protein
MRAAGDRAHGLRLRGLIAILWRSGLRIQEALALTEGDLDHRRGSLLVRRGKGGRRREVGMDAWGWEQLKPWLDLRRELPIGPLLCVINGTTRGRRWSPTAARAELRRTAGASFDLAAELRDDIVLVTVHAREDGTTLSDSSLGATVMGYRDGRWLEAGDPDPAFRPSVSYVKARRCARASRSRRTRSATGRWSGALSIGSGHHEVGRAGIRVGLRRPLQLRKTTDQEGSTEC